jgi:hypothetical protein
MVSAPGHGSNAALVVDVLHVASSYVAHDERDRLRSPRRDEQMDVIGHQHVGVDGAVVPARGMLQTCQIKALVLRDKEGGLAVVTALNDVLGHARNA